MNVSVLTMAEGARADIITVSLSRRNLDGLRRQLDEGKRGDPAQIMRRTAAGLVIVVAEEDDVHYHSEAREAVARGRAGESVPGVGYGEEIPAP